MSSILDTSWSSIQGDRFVDKPISIWEMSSKDKDIEEPDERISSVHNWEKFALSKCVCYMYWSWLKSDWERKDDSNTGEDPLHYLHPSNTISNTFFFFLQLQYQFFLRGQYQILNNILHFKSSIKLRRWTNFLRLK